MSTRHNIHSTRRTTSVANILPALSAVAILLTLQACETPQAIDPTVVATSYDYTKPADIAAQSQPVWVLPVINQGWIPASVDPKSGTWKSGHYEAVIVQDGYWATQEDAELSGRPYILAGDSTPIIPPPVADGPPVGEAGPELSIAALQSRITNVEKKQQEFAEQKTDADAMAEMAAQMRAIGTQLPANETITVPTTPSQNFNSGISIPNASQPPAQTIPKSSMNLGENPSPIGKPTAQPTGETTLLLPRAPAGTSLDFPVSEEPGDKLTVHYLNDLQVEVNYLGKQYLVQLKNAGDQIRITVPKKR